MKFILIVLATHQWTTKPNGRVAVSLPIVWTSINVPNAGHIDLSVIGEKTK